MNTSRLRFLSAPLAVLVLAVSAAACGDDSGSDSGSDGVTVVDAWVREPAEGQASTAGYGVITNNSGEEITLVGATAPITATFELHETTMTDDGVMSMQEREGGFVIADGDTLALEPGGAHVMMLGIDPDEFSGEYAAGFDLTFVFDGADDVTVPAELQAIPASDEMDEMEMDEMDESELEESDS